MKVSVVMAVYNGEKYLLEQLDSIKNQTRAPDEVLIGDDGSSDSSVALIKDYIRNNNLSWQITVNSARKGFGRNFFSLMNRCTGDVIFPADQDDVWRLDKIEKMVEMLEKNNNIALLISTYQMVPMDFSCRDFNSRNIPLNPEKSGVVRLSLYDVISQKDKTCPYAGMAQCIRASFYFNAFKNMNHFPVVHDRIMVLLAADAGAFYKLNDFTVFHRVHVKNTSGVNRSVLDKIFRISVSERLKFLENFINEDQSYLDSQVCMSNTLREYLVARSKYQNERVRAIRSGDASRIFRVFLQNRKKGHISVLSFLSDCKYILAKSVFG